ncbi:hypothetical protein GQR58_030570 [Nymphon striatum]|nr:hypothetical protein GQR58_030570 [Nymphon striatum]
MAQCLVCQIAKQKINFNPLKKSIQKKEQQLQLTKQEFAGVDEFIKRLPQNIKELDLVGEYDEIYLRDIPNFEWTDSFSAALWMKTSKREKLKTQQLLGTTGRANGISLFINGNKTDSNIEYDRLYKSIQTPVQIPKKKLPKSDAKAYWINNSPKVVKKEQELKKLRTEWLDLMKPVMEIMVMEEMPENRQTYAYSRGDYTQAHL